MDVRRPAQVFVSAWRSFLWSEGSPIREALDEPVTLLREGEATHYRAGNPVAECTTLSTAILLPDSMVLSRVLTLPGAAEANINTVVALEAKASSPFPEDDTAYGWSITGRNDETIQVKLAICARSAVMEYLAAHYQTHDHTEYEIWAGLDGAMLVIPGFGETRRHQRYRGELVRIGRQLALLCVVLIASVALAAGLKYLEMKRVESNYEEVRRRAATAVDLRETLSQGNRTVDAANELIGRQVDFYPELVRLSSLLGDDTWLTQLELRSGEFKINGQSPDAAAVMQKLTDEPVYSDVNAPAAIRKSRRGNVERFVLEINFDEDPG